MTPDRGQPGAGHGEAQETVHHLLSEYGTTYAQQAGIMLKDEPAPLYQLLVLTDLLSARIGADLAVEGTKALLAQGWTTPRKMHESTWKQRVAALDRGHYARYDESTARQLGEGAQMVLQEYDGDLRRLRQAVTEDAGAVGDEEAQAREAASGISRRLQQFPGIGPTGASIFLREVQGVWPQVAPYFDKKALQEARMLGLPDDAQQLGGLVSPQDLPRLAAALVRSSLSR